MLTVKRMHCWVNCHIDELLATNECVDGSRKAAFQLQVLGIRFRSVVAMKAGLL